MTWPTVLAEVGVKVKETEMGETERISITLERFNSWYGAWHKLFLENPIIGCLVVFIMLDIMTGCVAAWRAGVYGSRSSYKGMMGKAQMILVVTAAKFSEFIIPGGPWGNAVAGFFCLTELTSIVENAGKAGVPVPKAWMDAMAAFRYNDEVKPVNVQVNTEIHTDKQQDVNVTSTETRSKNKREGHDSDTVRTVVKLSDSQVIEPKDVSDDVPPQH